MKTVTYCLISIFFLTPALTQSWRQIHLDTFAVDNNGIIISAEEHPGIAIRKFPTLNYSNRFWIKGDIWFSDSPLKSDVYFVFGMKLQDSLRVWAAGYSLKEKNIIVGKVDFSDQDKLHLQIIKKKPVEIIDRRNQFVFKFIFSMSTDEIKAEVNGVPMTAQLPFSTKSLTHFGYMIMGKAVRFESFQVNGD